MRTDVCFDCGERPNQARGLCRRCYARRLRANALPSEWTQAPRTPYVAGLTTDELFDSKWTLDPTTGCHIWAGGRSHFGHGRFALSHSQEIRAHVYAYERKHGPVPTGLVLDHVVCDNPPCCNPDHVRPTTKAANVLRSAIAAAGVNSRKTRCPQGHPYDEANTYRRDGKRHCRECARKACREWARRRRAIRAEQDEPPIHLRRQHPAS